MMGEEADERWEIICEGITVVKVRNGMVQVQS